jgi:hypothetical protein
MKPVLKYSIAIICVLLFFFLLGYFLKKWRDEDGLFLRLINDLREEKSVTKYNEDSLITNSLHMVHHLLNKNNKESLNKEDNFNATWIQSSESELEYVRGACGSYSMVLARVLKTEGFDVKIGQLLTDKVHANHIIVEVKKMAGKWIVLDPFYDLYFINREGALAGFEEVRDDWDYFKLNLPDNYYHEYRFKNIRYTNWGRFPVAGKIARKIFSLTIGEERTSKLSIRTFILNKYRIFFFLVLLFYFPFLILILVIRKLLKKKVFGRKKIGGAVPSGTKTD